MPLIGVFFLCQGLGNKILHSFEILDVILESSRSQSKEEIQVKQEEYEKHSLLFSFLACAECIFCSVVLLKAALHYLSYTRTDNHTTFQLLWVHRYSASMTQLQIKAKCVPTLCCQQGLCTFLGLCYPKLTPSVLILCLLWMFNLQNYKKH